jgi:hypothetical protein
MQSHAVVGPLLKKEYIEAINSFEVWKAFPDYKANPFGFACDPEVWHSWCLDDSRRLLSSVLARSPALRAIDQL